MDWKLEVGYLQFTRKNPKIYKVLTHPKSSFNGVFIEKS